MADPAVKPEIKADPADTKDGLADVDEFEEDHDLYIPPDPPQGWLARVPPELWQAWNEMYNNAHGGEMVRIGTLRVHDINPEQVEQKVEIFLENGV